MPPEYKLTWTMHDPSTPSVGWTERLSRSDFRQLFGWLPRQPSTKRRVIYHVGMAVVQFYAPYARHTNICTTWGGDGLGILFTREGTFLPNPQEKKRTMDAVVEMLIRRFSYGGRKSDA